MGSHDNLVYVYTVDQGGRKVSRLGKCSVSGQVVPSPRHHPAQWGAELTIFLPQGSHSFRTRLIFLSRLDYVEAPQLARSPPTPHPHPLLCSKPPPFFV